MVSHRSLPHHGRYGSCYLLLVLGQHLVGESHGGEFGAVARGGLLAGLSHGCHCWLVKRFVRVRVVHR